jgi:DNA polymerase IV (DinB-like DNA polymerase)
MSQTCCRDCKGKIREHLASLLPFKVLESVVDKPLRIGGIAMAAGMSRNFNVYTPEELQSFASKLVGAPVYIEHVNVNSVSGKVTKCNYDAVSRCLLYEAEIYDQAIADKIRNGLIQHVSVSADYSTLDSVDAKVPRGLYNPELSFVAVPVPISGADPKEGKGRGVVSTSNYEARKSGVRSGMPISQAWRLFPRAVYLPPNFPLYIKVSGELMAYADKFEQWGIDEAFLDVPGRVKDYAEAEALARQIKQEIKDKQNLTASIGVGPNKLVAKVASDFQKPDGLTIVREEDVEKFLEPLPVRKLLWVGRKTEAKLKALGVNTIGDLARYDPSALTSMFGVMGLQMHLMAKGIDRSEVEERVGVKSISHETTFEEDTADPQTITEALVALCVDVQKETENQHLLFKTVTLKIRYQNFETTPKAKPCHS